VNINKVLHLVKYRISSVAKLPKKDAFKRSRFSRGKLAVFAVIFAGIGGYFVFSSFAAGPLAAIEAENGTLVAPASIVSDSAASGGKAVQFGGAASASCAVTTANVPDGRDPWGGCFPGPSNTGVPSGTVLSTYTGSCTITVANTIIDSKTINCSPLGIAAANVQIKNSKLNGYPWIDNFPNPYSFSVTDSEIDGGSGFNEGTGKSNFVLTRVKIHGAHRGAWCEYNCTVQDSYIYGQAVGVLNCSTAGCAWHESAVRQGSNSDPTKGQKFLHNTLWCDAPNVDANDPNSPTDTSGCSADMTGYGDFAPMQNNTVDKNLFMATPGGTCAYGGSSGDNGSKPYGNQAMNQVFTNNIFQHGPAGDHGTRNCGYYFPISDFSSTRPGAVWTNNKWDDGTALPPDR
jgi:hypothetical protein